MRARTVRWTEKTYTPRKQSANSATPRVGCFPAAIELAKELVRERNNISTVTEKIVSGVSAMTANKLARRNAESNEGACSVPPDYFETQPKTNRDNNQR